MFVVACIVMYFFKFSIFLTDSNSKGNSKLDTGQSLKFSVLASKVHDVMNSYSTSRFNYTNKSGTKKYILFWNEAYGSKDYGNWISKQRVLYCYNM